MKPPVIATILAWLLLPLSLSTMIIVWWGYRGKDVGFSDLTSCFKWLYLRIEDI